MTQQRHTFSKLSCVHYQLKSNIVSIMKNHLLNHMPGTKVRCLRCICGKQSRTHLHRSCISSSVISVSSHIAIESNHCEESTYAGFDHTSQSRGRIYICRVWWKRSHPNHYPDHSHQSEARGILRPNHASSQQGNLSGFPLNISCVLFYFNFVTFTFSSPKTTHHVPNLSSICLTLQIISLSSFFQRWQFYLRRCHCTVGING